MSASLQPMFNPALPIHSKTGIANCTGLLTASTSVL
jgi:hypothetical protein